LKPNILSTCQREIDRLIICVCVAHTHESNPTNWYIMCINFGIAEKCNVNGTLLSRKDEHN